MSEEKSDLGSESPGVSDKAEGTPSKLVRRRQGASNKTDPFPSRLPAFLS